MEMKLKMLSEEAKHKKKQFNCFEFRPSYNSPYNCLCNYNSQNVDRKITKRPWVLDFSRAFLKEQTRTPRIVCENRIVCLFLLLSSEWSVYFCWHVCFCFFQFFLTLNEQIYIKTLYWMNEGGETMGLRSGSQIVLLEDTSPDLYS